MDKEKNLEIIIPEGELRAKNSLTVLKFSYKRPDGIMVADKSYIYDPAFQLKDYPAANIYSDLPIVFTNLFQAQAFGLPAAFQEREKIIYRRHGLPLSRNIQFLKRAVV
mgnify:FL=1